MKKKKLWGTLLSKFFIFFNRTKNDERPSKGKQIISQKSVIEDQQVIHSIRGIVLPNKENIMVDEFSGFTKTKIKIEEVYDGDLTSEMIISICEPYYEGYYAGEKCMIVHEGYEPLSIGKTYLFLLIKDDKSKDSGYYKELEHKAS